MTSPRRFLLPVAAAGLIGGAGGAALEQHTGTAAAVAAPTAQVQTVAGDIYTESKDAVAYITAGDATGTGFVISADGYVVTNAHVIDGARTVKVKVGDTSTKVAEVVGEDTSTDVALLKVDATNLPTLALGDSNSAAVGDEVFAIGNPYGLDRTLTTGVVSALHRSIESPAGYPISGAVQTDAALNPGNSGGPLIDTAGRVIGINSQVQSQSSGLGFAVPSNTVKRVVAQLRATGEATHAYLGVGTSDSGDDGGATVSAVTDNSPAAEAGLQRGDQIIRLGGEDIYDAEDLSAAIDGRAPGDHVALTVRRNGGTRTVMVALSTRPAA